ncbi:hypothetical protein ACYZT4_10805 [Pseudomonas sp. GB2N2]
MATAEQFIAGFKQRHATPQKTPINWRKKYEAERRLVIDEAIIKLKDEMRCKPAEWARGYNSAITTLELMKGGK